LHQLAAVELQIVGAFDATTRATSYDSTRRLFCHPAETSPVTCRDVRLATRLAEVAAGDCAALTLLGQAAAELRRLVDCTTALKTRTNVQTHLEAFAVCEIACTQLSPDVGRFQWTPIWPNSAFSCGICVSGSPLHSRRRCARVLGHRLLSELVFGVELGLFVVDLGVAVRLPSSWRTLAGLSPMFRMTSRFFNQWCAAFSIHTD
jgi:hypothetical protein